jgi:hypothetical protein
LISEKLRPLDDGAEHVHIKGHYLDFDGQDFRQSSTALGIT